MRNVVIIHGCPSNKWKAINPKTRTYDKHWIPWTKAQLTMKGYKVNAPLMPNPWMPNYEVFKKEFEKYSITDESVLIGHSCGCAFLVRWLGESKQKVDKLILVAPWKIPHREHGSDEEFYDYPIDETVKERVNSIIIFTADDEAEEGKKSAKIFHDALEGELIELKGKGHYTQNDMGAEEFPDLLKIITD